MSSSIKASSKEILFSLRRGSSVVILDKSTKVGIAVVCTIYAFKTTGALKTPYRGLNGRGCLTRDINPKIASPLL